MSASKSKALAKRVNIFRQKFDIYLSGNVFSFGHIAKRCTASIIKLNSSGNSFKAFSIKLLLVRSNLVCQGNVLRCGLTE